LEFHLLELLRENRERKKDCGKGEKEPRQREVGKVLSRSLTGQVASPASSPSKVVAGIDRSPVDKLRDRWHSSVENIIGAKETSVEVL
jgi:hypothetical protein